MFIVTCNHCSVAISNAIQTSKRQYQIHNNLITYQKKLFQLSIIAEDKFSAACLRLLFMSQFLPASLLPIATR